MLLDDMGDYLSSGGVGTVGTDLFLGFLPEQPDTAVVVYETGGIGPVHTMGNVAGQATVERPSVQVVARAVDPRASRALAQKAFMLLDGMPNRLVNGVRYYWGEATQSPFFLQRDAQQRVWTAFNVSLIKDMSTTS